MQRKGGLVSAEVRRVIKCRCKEGPLYVDQDLPDDQNDVR